MNRSIQWFRWSAQSILHRSGRRNTLWYLLSIYFVFIQIVYITRYPISNICSVFLTIVIVILSISCLSLVLCCLKGLCLEGRKNIQYDSLMTTLHIIIYEPCTSGYVHVFEHCATRERHIKLNMQTQP